MNNIFRRKRTQAIVDKKRSVMVYDKLDESTETNRESKKSFFQRLSLNGLSEIDLEAIKQVNNKANKEEDELPLPSKKGNDKEINDLKFNNKAYVINNFDEYKLIENSYSLINASKLLGKIKEEDLKQLQFSDLYSFDHTEYDKAYNKIDEMKRIAKGIKDNELSEYFRAKKRFIEREKAKIKLVSSNVEKLEDFIIFDDSVKFFFNMNK